MPRFARKCKCGNIVRYKEDDGTLYTDLALGYFRGPGLVKRAIHRRTKAGWSSRVRLVVRSVSTDSVLRWRTTVIYCKCGCRMKLSLFTEIKYD